MATNSAHGHLAEGRGERGAPYPPPAARINNARTPNTAPAVAPAEAPRRELPGFCATTPPTGLQNAPNSPSVQSDPNSQGMPAILHGRCHGTTPPGTLASSQMLKNSFFCTPTQRYPCVYPATQYESQISGMQWVDRCAGRGSTIRRVSGFTLRQKGHLDTDRVAIAACRAAVVDAATLSKLAYWRATIRAAVCVNVEHRLQALLA